MLRLQVGFCGHDSLEFLVPKSMLYRHKGLGVLIFRKNNIETTVQFSGFSDAHARLPLAHAYTGLYWDVLC